MLSDKMQDALNDQINFELYSSYIYFSMSAYFESLNLAGMSGWMRVQAMEELTHVKRFFSFINDRGGRVKMKEIGAPAAEWDSPLAAFEVALAHERIVSGRINKLVDLARSESDHAADTFLQWFVAEQVEEESSVDEVVQKLKLVGNDGAGLFMIDQELVGRGFVMPPGVTL